MKTTTTKRRRQAVRVSLNHQSSIPLARWCVPVGWEPQNEIDEAEFLDGSWWTAEGEAAGLVWFGDGGSEGDVIEANLDDLRVASCGDCQVIGEVRLDAA